VLRLAAATIDLDGLSVHRDGVRYPLTVQEAELLRYLARVDRVVSRKELLTQVWGYAPGLKTRAVDATVSRLRAKLERDSKHPEALTTVRGKGYRLVIQPEPLTAEPAAGLLGRDAERVAVEQALDRGEVVELIGPGGAGKTSLARAVCTARGGRFVDLQNAQTLDDATSALARVLGIRRLNDTDEQARIATALAHEPRLTVLDNLEQLPPERADWVEALRGSAPLLLTSRTPIRADHTRIDIGPLPPADARHVLAAAAMRRNPRWPGATDAELDALCAAADGLPLHLELVGAHLATTRATALLERLDALIAHGDGRPGRHASRASVVEWSWSMLHPLDQRRLAWWSLVRGPLDIDVLEAIGPHDTTADAETAPTVSTGVIDTLARVEAAAMLDTASEGPRMWVAVRAFAAARLDAHGDREAAETAHARWFAAQVPPDLTRLEAGSGWAAFATKWDADLRSVAERFVEKDPVRAARAALGRLAGGRSLGIGIVAPLLALAQRAADASGDPHLKMGARLARLDELRRVPVDAAAQLEACSALEAHAPIPLRLARMHHEASLLRRVGDLEAALQSYRAARELARAHGRLGRIAGIDHDEAATLRRMGRLDEARILFHRSLAGQGEGVPPRLAALCLQALASIARLEGRADDAMALGARAVDAARDADDPYVLGGALTNHGNALTSAGRHEEAASVGREAVSVLERAGVRTTLSFALGNLGSVLDRLGDRLEAELLIQRALALADASGVPYAAAYWRGRLADIAHRDGRLDAALAGYEEARERLQSAGADVHRIEALMAVVYAERGERARARELLERATPLQEGSPSDRGAWHLCAAAVANWSGAEVDPGVVAPHRGDPELHVCEALFDRSLQRT
jgi:DNA-binding winged helix-turn-helix (wHTH) protein/tetratricopeptide (TPR) repeat protein